MNNEIWLLLDSRGLGGIETHVLQLANGIKTEGHAVSVVFLRDHGPHPLKDQLTACKIPFTCLSGQFVNLLSHIRSHRPMVIHTHGYKAGIMGRVAARLCGTRVVSTFHAGESGTGRLALYDWCDRHLAWLAHKSFAVSQRIAAKVPGCHQVLNNFIDTTHLVPSIGKQIAFVGRLSHEKAPDRFIELARCFRAHAFHIYGDGPMAEMLKQHAPTNVIFHGQQDDMNPIWPQIGLLIVPSRYEGLPMAALEAMGRHIPLVASKVGAIPKLIKHKKNGWLVDEGQLAQLTEYVADWINYSDTQRTAMGKAAKQTILSHYASTAVVPSIISSY
ncbi:glycosyltransferase family 1 protein [Alteromonas sediminis]|uniref:Glycosyltransferase family 1 protein n=1 Tax=Alteromonas sediminis TaxID=2259342 RepID=A0A3N5YF56_9ALTE|nr:glycosyltransferase family 4 protein [Alteromonas sediminis]RPJ68585.1 glycosyltransferase family 1 protein [Alteromonas sediminis]